MNTLARSEISNAIALFEQFRNEFIHTLSENFVTKHGKLRVGSGASVLAMVMAFGVANLHAAIVKNVIGATLEDDELRNHHRATGALIYALMSGPRSQEDAESACNDFSDLYSEISRQQNSSQMSAYVEAGFDLGALDRACRENSENPSLREDLAQRFLKLSEDIHTVSTNAK
jgi:hypothetical protein